MFIAIPEQNHKHYQFTLNTVGNRVVLTKTVVLGLVYLDRKEFSPQADSIFTINTKLLAQRNLRKQ